MTLRVDERRIWILELFVFGRPERFATERLEIPTEDGGLVVVREGLQDFAMPKATGDVGELAVALSIAADDLQGVAGPLDQVGGWAGLYSAGYDLERQPARLLRFKPGTLWENARTVLRGVVEEVAIGGALEPLEFTLARSPTRQGRPMIPADAKVDVGTWPVRGSYDLDENLLGAWYPLVIGYPGHLGTPFTTTELPRVPAYLVEDAQTPTPTARESQLLIAGHSVDATEVLVFESVSQGPAPSDFRPVFEVQDANGRTVSVVDFDGSSLDHAIGTAYYSSWSSVGGRGGGLQRRDKSGPVRGLGELLKRLLEDFSDLEIDSSAMESERTFLDRVKIDSFVNEPPDVWDWIRSELFQLLPLKVVEGPGGIWIRLMRYDAPKTAAKLFLDGDDARVSRVSKLTSTNWDSVANDIRLDFAPNRNAPNFSEHRVLSGSPDPNDPSASFSYRCGISQRRLELPGKPGSGVRTKVLKGGAHLFDPVSVGNILRIKAAELAIPHKRGTWVGPESLEDELEPADLILVRDSEVGIPEPRLALVDDVTVGQGETRVALIVLEDPARIVRNFRNL